MGHYAIYGDLGTREAVTLATVLHAKGVEVEFIEETASLAWALASRAGREEGPYLRTPEGFVLADLHAMLEFIERIHPRPQLLPTTPVRRTCTRLLEDWLELWLPHWPRRSWGSLERLGVHLGAAGFLLGSRPTRADWMLAGWLESEVVVHENARSHLTQKAPRLVSFGDDLLAQAISVDLPVDLSSEMRSGLRSSRPSGRPEDDAIPISLLGLLEEIARDYHAYLVLNHQALKDGEDSVDIDLGVGPRTLPVQARAEERRLELGREIKRLERSVRRRVTEVLEPVGAWHALTLPPALEEMDPADPRSL